MAMRETILKKLEALTETMNGGVRKGQLKVGKKRSTKTISKDNIMLEKRKVSNCHVYTTKAADD